MKFPKKNAGSTNARFASEKYAKTAVISLQAAIFARKDVPTTSFLELATRKMTIEEVSSYTYPVS